MVLALVLKKREIDDPTAIGRRMRKPVRELIVRELLGVAAVGPHAPDLHFAAAIGVVIDESPVGRIVGPGVESLARRDAALIAAVGGDGIDVELTVAPAHERQRLS